MFLLLKNKKKFKIKNEIDKNECNGSTVSSVFNKDNIHFVTIYLSSG